ncbi:Helicase associated domain protein [Streptomyces sp. NPDC042638]|uniref:Helicase associated domain protein n=1 Tax=Streptomyces sp. NPDC042638 TaxID=3154333 RepID=UPI0033DA2CCF
MRTSRAAAQAVSAGKDRRGSTAGVGKAGARPRRGPQGRPRGRRPASRRRAPGRAPVRLRRAGDPTRGLRRGGAARRFARELAHTLRLLRRTDPGLAPGIDPELFFAHGEHTPAQRAGIFASFAAADTAILANSKLIAEGVDIPSVDAIVFADPTRSVIRCVQALGRALRLDVSGKIASLIVPVYIPPGTDSENILGTAYEPVWAIACALASHDHRILERLPDKANRLPRETSDVIARRWHFDFTVHPERIAQAMDLVSFDPRDQGVSRSRRLGLAAARSYRDQYGHLDVPADYTDPTGYRLGTFITTMRDAAKVGRLDADADADWIAELDALGMI